MLNWEKDHRKTMPREYAPDTLPDTGSWQDRVRWTRTKSTPRAAELRVSKKAVAVIDGNDHSAFLLRYYVNCIKSPEFSNKTLDQRKEILIRIGLTIQRLINSKKQFSREVSELIDQGTAGIRRFSKKCRS